MAFGTSTSTSYNGTATSGVATASESITSVLGTWPSLLVSLAAIYLAYLCYTPSIDRKAPAFTSDTHLLFGSWNFIRASCDFFLEAISRSKTGHFSFWVGKHHVVGISGEAARKMYLDSRQLDFSHGNNVLQALGPDVRLNWHPIFNMNFSGSQSFFQRRLLDVSRPDQILRLLPKMVKDARESVTSLAGAPLGMVSPFPTFYTVVLRHNCRLVCSDELADDKTRVTALERHLLMLQCASSRHMVAFPWLPSWVMMKRIYASWGVWNIMASELDPRLRLSRGKGSKSPRKADALQTLIDLGDRRDWILNWLMSMIYVTIVNAGVLVGGFVFTMAHQPVWQEKIYAEIKAACAVHAKDKTAPLVDQLSSLPIEAWESAFPVTDLCYRELMRLHTAFPMFRKNCGPDPIKIPGTDEVIPVGSFASYNTADAHYNERLYPNHDEYDPERFLPHRQEHKKEEYSFVGWGAGRHPCLGMRWAKLQLKVIAAHALAQYKWVGCDDKGNEIPPIKIQKDANARHVAIPGGVYCKCTSRGV